MLCPICETRFFIRSSTFYHQFCNECIEDALEILDEELREEIYENELFNENENDPFYKQNFIEDVEM
jgi:hypothetical protein